MKQALRSVVVAVSWLVALAAGATDLSNSVPGSITDGVDAIEYRLFVPQGLVPGQKVPLILFLHGMGDRGIDNVSQADWMEELQQRTKSGPYAAYVLAPQAKRNMWFGRRFWARDALPLSLGALRQVMNDEPHVDRRRVYVTGVSMGAYGVWDLLKQEPRLFAAAVPMSGIGDPSTGASIDTPVWAFHGDHDTQVHCNGSRAIVAAMKFAGKDVRYTEVKGGNHFIWPDCYSRDDLYAWMFAQHRADDGVFASERRLERMTPVAGVGKRDPRVGEPAIAAVACTAAGWVAIRRRRRRGTPFVLVGPRLWT